MSQIRAFFIYAVLYGITPKRISEFAGPNSESLRTSNTAPLEEMLPRWRAVGNTVANLTGSRFEPQTSRSRDERITARPSGWWKSRNNLNHPVSNNNVNYNFAGLQ